MAGAPSLQQTAAAMLDAMPPWPDIWWHGRDGKPCPCAVCCTRALREMASALDAAPKRKAARR